MFRNLHSVIRPVVGSELQIFAQAAGREPLDANSLSADSRAHRATRVVPNLMDYRTRKDGDEQPRTPW